MTDFPAGPGAEPVAPAQPAAPAPPAQPAAPVAPATGGEQPYEGSDLYRQVLADVPEQFRPSVEPHLRKWDQGVNPKLQEAAELRQQFEPYQQIEGFQDLEPETVQALVQLHGMFQDPDALTEWVVNEVAPALGLQVEGYEPQPVGEGEEPGGVPDWAQPLMSWFEEQQQTQALDGWREHIRTELDEVRSGDDKITDDDEDAIYRFALAYADEDPEGCVKKGYEDFKALLARTQGSLYDGLQGQPGVAVNGGQNPSTAEEVPRSFKDARAAAAERLAKEVGQTPAG